MRLSKKEMQEVVEQVKTFLHENDIILKPPVDVYSIAAKLGFKISMIKSDELDGYIITNENANQIFDIPTKRLIGVNEDLGLEMRRFIVSHEFGHFQMNANGKSMYAHRESRKGKDKDEQKADFFAANILMPEMPFLQCVGITIKEFKCGFKEGINILASFFLVPKESVIRRIEELDELNDTDYTGELKASGV